MGKIILFLFFIEFTSNAHANVLPLTSGELRENKTKISQIISKVEQWGTLQDKKKQCIAQSYLNTSIDIRSFMWRFIILMQKDISENEQEKIFIKKLGLNGKDFDNIVGPMIRSCEINLQINY